MAKKNPKDIKTFKIQYKRKNIPNSLYITNQETILDEHDAVLKFKQSIFDSKNVIIKSITEIKPNSEDQGE